MKAPDLSRVSCQSYHRPRRVGLHIPDFDCLVMTSTDDPSSIKLDTRDASRVTLESPDMTLASHPGSPELVSLNKHLPPVYWTISPSLQLNTTSFCTKSILWSPDEINSINI